MTAGIVPVPTVFESARVPHQVRIKGSLETGLLSATCSCLIKADGSYTPLLEDERLSPREILAAQARHELEVATS